MRMAPSKKGPGKKILLVGLTGGIGSGKSTAGDFFIEAGAVLIQADLIARNMIDTDVEIKRELISVFGRDIYLPGGKIDRGRLAGKIFTNRRNLLKLNRIVHPRVIANINKIVTILKKYHVSPFILVEAALIFEARTESSYDYIIVIEADEKQRISRLMKRDGRTREEIMRRFRSQLPAKSKSAKGDFVINNSGNPAGLKKRCRLVYDLLEEISSGRKTDAAEQMR